MDGGDESGQGEVASPRLETAIVVAVDLAELETIYRESYPAFAALGIPLHVTLVYPFAPPTELPSTLPLLQTVVGGHARFIFI